MEKDYVVVMDPMGGAHLEHRSHKYTKREWQGKCWRYWYGTQYKKDAEKARAEIKRTTNYLNDVRGLITNDKNDLYNPMLKKRAYTAREHIAENARTAYNSQKLYDKSLAGRIEKGKKTVDALLSKLKKKVNDTAIKTAKKLGFKTQQTETRTDISTGQKWRRVNGGAWEKVR
ncbi:MAG: hypothetical protein J6Y02_22195 [Pseudobutyrivibrio sp.]|nr:hypothetical protein [Pseudobutyrivibrio sp.]